MAYVGIYYSSALSSVHIEGIGQHKHQLHAGTREMSAFVVSKHNSVLKITDAATKGCLACVYAVKQRHCKFPAHVFESCSALWLSWSPIGAATDLVYAVHCRPGVVTWQRAALEYAVVSWPCTVVWPGAPRMAEELLIRPWASCWHQSDSSVEWVSKHDILFESTDNATTGCLACVSCYCPAQVSPVLQRTLADLVSMRQSALCCQPAVYRSAFYTVASYTAGSCSGAGLEEGEACCGYACSSSSQPIAQAQGAAKALRWDIAQSSHAPCHADACVCSSHGHAHGSACTPFPLSQPPDDMSS